MTLPLSLLTKTKTKNEKKNYSILLKATEREGQQIKRLPNSNILNNKNGPQTDTKCAQVKYSDPLWVNPSQPPILKSEVRCRASGCLYRKSKREANYLAEIPPWSRLQSTDISLQQGNSQPKRHPSHREKKPPPNVERRNNEKSSRKQAHILYAS